MSERTLHLLVPGDPAQLTGGTLYDRRIAQALEGLGWSVTILTLPGDYPQAGQKTRAQAAAVLARIPENALTVVDGLALGALPEVFAVHAARLRLVGLVHHPLADETGLDTATRDALCDAERRALANVHGVITTSQFTRERVAAYGVPSEAIRVAPPGTDPAPAAVGHAGTVTRLLCVAAVIPRKGYAILVDALAMLADRAWHCDCIGSTERDSEHAAAIRQHIAGVGLAGRIRLHGALSPAALTNYYLKSDLFVLASHYEGFGMVLSEAVAHGLPVIAAAGGAAREAVPGRAGRLVAPNDAAALAEALAGCLGDSDAYQRLQAEAQRARSQLPDWHQAAATFGHHLERLSQ